MNRFRDYLIRLVPLAVCVSVAAAARAGTHDTTYPPLAKGPYPVACSNVAQDPAKIMTVNGGGDPSDFWEGRDNNGQLRYISQVLLEPSGTLQYNAPVPDEGIYPQFRGQTQNFVLIVCYPTTDTNTRPDYRLPDNVGVVPKMQRGNEPPLIRGFEQCRPLCIDPPPSGAALAELSRRPLILYSHGMGGSPISEDYLTTIAEMASQGYIVAAPFHGDARFSKVRVQDLGQLVTFLRDFDKFAEMELLRPVALKSALDYLLSQPAYAAAIRTDQIGGFGASMGGQAMVNLLGAKLTVTLGKSCAQTVTDPRVKAAVGYVPYFGQTFLPSFCDNQDGAAAITRPYLAITGSTDTTAPQRVTEQGINRFQGTRYLVELVDVPHQYLLSYRDDVFSWTVTFLDAFVKGDRSALARLNGTRNIVGGLTDNVKVSYTAAPNVQGLFWNSSEPGHGISLTQQGNQVFAAWYLYDSSGRPTWLVVPATTWNADFSEFTGDAYQPTGSYFAQYDASRFRAGTPIGRLLVRLPASYDDTSRFSVSFSGVGTSGSKTFERFAFAPTNSTPAPGSPELDDLWWGGTAQNGWGIAIHRDRGAYFSAWYTYDTAGRATWYTIQGGSFFGAGTQASPVVYVADVFRNEGAPVLGTPYDPSRLRSTKAGSVSIEFSTDFNTARMTYDVDGGKGVYSLSRFPFP